MNFKTVYDGESQFEWKQRKSKFNFLTDTFNKILLEIILLYACNNGKTLELPEMR